MPKLFRIRFIPQESIDISSDNTLYRDNCYLITSWKPIRSRTDIISGVSCVFLEEGWKISAFMDREDHIKYWYCDIIDIKYDPKEDTYFLYDLLIDIIIREDGKVEVIDLEELAKAFDEGLITKEQLAMSLIRSNNLLRKIYQQDIPAYVTDIIRSHTGIHWGIE